jgi:hypothetical protein
MKRLLIFIGALAILVVALGYTFHTGFARDDKIPRKPDRPMDKREFYNQYVAPKFGRTQLEKPSTFQDRKRSVLDVGNLVVRHNNAGTWGYDRWGLNHVWPAGSKLTYYWTLGPMIGAKKRLPDGKLGISMATGVRGTVRDHEEEFQPLPGYDTGAELDPATKGIAYSDQPDTWPARWPIETDPTGTYKDLITALSFPGIERPLDKDQSGGRGFRFPGAFNGTVVADREAYMVFTDNDPKDGNIGQFNNGVGPLNVRIDAWAMQWSDVINEDFIIWRHVFTNVGPDTLFDVYVGMHGDPDTPEQGTFEWTDDFALFIAQGDTAWDPLLWNTVVVWDGDDKAEGFIASNVPWMSIKVLETPDDPATGKPKGLTTMYLFLYSEDAQSDEQAYNQQMASGIEKPDNVQPHPDDYTQTPNSYGPDITFVFASGPFTLPPGASLPFTIADILGANKPDVLSNSALAQILFNNDYKAPEPPKEPWVRAVAGDRKVTLYWDATPSETSADRLTGNNRFQGYRVYRSTDRGVSWGQPITDVNGTVIGYVPMAQFDLVDGISGVDPLAPELYLGDDVGLQHSFVDRNVINGIEYWYAVTAYDSRDETGVLSIRPLENPRRNNPYLEGDNTVSVVPMPPVAGYKGASVSAVQHSAGVSDGTIEVEILDPALVTNHTYRVTFNPQNRPTTAQIVDVTDNNKVLISGVPVAQPTDVTTDQISSFHGLRVKAVDTRRGVKSASGAATVRLQRTQFANSSGAGTLHDFEFRFVAAPLTYADWDNGTPVTAPFEVWDLTTNTQITCEIFDAGDGDGDGAFDFGERVAIVISPYMGTGSWEGNWPVDYGFVFDFTTSSTAQPGDVFKIVSNKVFAAEDVFEFSTKAEEKPLTNLREALAAVKVVPNPYVVSSVFETSLLTKVVQFRHLPKECTIRIYNMAGELVRVIEHTNGTSLEPWDLRTYNAQEVAFGVYVYHITTPSGEESLGKFAIIK